MIFDLTNVNGTLFFVTTDGTDGYQLWRSDGTAGGTSMVTDVNPTTGGLSPSDLTNANGKLFFVASDGTNGQQLWETDGTAAGTVELTTLNAANGGINPFDLVNVNGTLFFVASDGTNGEQLWKSDGTAAGTVEVTKLNPKGVNEFSPNGFEPGDLVAFDGKVFFSACDGSTDAQGNPVAFNLWESDGTAAGTQRLTDLTNGNVLGAKFGSEQLGQLTVIDNTLYFVANEFGSQLWKSDGTLAGTVSLGQFSGVLAAGINLTGVDGEVYFEGLDQRSLSNGNTYDLWKSDGTTSGTGLALPALEGLDITPITTPVPVLEPIPSVLVAYTSAGATPLTPNVLVSDPSNTTLTGAVVTIASGLLTGDTLSANTSNTAIMESYNSGTGVLTLTGTDTLANYQTVLELVTYATSNPDPTSSGADASRQLTFVVNQGGNASIVASATLDLNPTILPFNATVPSGHTFSGIEVPAGITLEVLSGGTTSAITVSGQAAVEQVDLGGLAVGTMLLAGGDQSVDGTASGTVVNSGGEEDVGNDGTTSGTIVNSGGLQYVDGTAIDTVVNSGGTQSASFGTASGTIVNSGGLLDVANSASDTTVGSGGEEVVEAFGSASDITIDGGLVVLSSGSFDSGGVVLENGGTLQIDDTAMPSVTISGFDVRDTIVLGGVAYDGAGSATLLSGNILAITESGQTYDLQLDPNHNFGGEAFSLSPDPVSGTDVTVAGTVISSGSIRYVGGTTSDTTLSGGTQVVFGTADDTAIDSGGIQDVVAGGAASGTTVSSGGTQYDAGTASGTTLSGGTQVVFGNAAGTTVDSRGTQDVMAGGTASGTAVSSGGTQYDAGTASGTTLSGGTEVVFGTAAGTTIASGGTQQVVAGGTTSDTTVSSGGTQYDAGTASNTTLSGGTQVVFGSAANTTVDNGGTQDVVAGGMATGATVSSGGLQNDAGSAIGATLSGGTQVVFASATSTTVDSGGIESVAAGGTASGTTVSTGGIQYDAGTAISTTLSGGVQAVYGSAAGTTIDSGGYEVALSGGTVGGATISGGTLELQSGSTAGNSTITFAGGGTLKLDAAGAYGFLVAGFAVPDAFDLSSINFASATKGYMGNTSSGTLTVNDGTHSASILLLGNYTAASFNLGKEGGGGTGTVVTDLPPANGGALQLTTPPHG